MRPQEPFKTKQEGHQAFDEKETAGTLTINDEENLDKLEAVKGLDYPKTGFMEFSTLART